MFKVKCYIENDDNELICKEEYEMTEEEFNEKHDELIEEFGIVVYDEDDNIVLDNL